MQYTTYYEYSLPDSDDVLETDSRVGYNNNFSDIDTQIKDANDDIDSISEEVDTISTQIGSLSSLITTDKSSIVNAINENAEAIQTNTEDIEALNTYSTTEKKIGTWVDGKPLYRKVFTFTPDSKNYTYTHNIPIDSIVSFKATKSGVSLPVLFISSTEALIQNSIGCWITQSVVRLLIGSLQTIADVTCIVEYTKTTD